MCPGEAPDDLDNMVTDYEPRCSRFEVCRGTGTREFTRLWSVAGTEVFNLKKTLRDDSLPAADRQAAADALWSMSVDFQQSDALRVLVSDEANVVSGQAGASMGLGQYLKFILEVAGFTPSVAVAEQCVDWVVWYDRADGTGYTPEEAVSAFGKVKSGQRYTGWLVDNGLGHVLTAPNGLEACLGPL